MDAIELEAQQARAVHALTSVGYAVDDVRVLPDGRVAWLHKLMFTVAICVGRIDVLTEPFGSYDDRWCYPSSALAATALRRWEPETEKEPDGWIRHPSSGRRRPGGDASKEYVNP